MTEEDEAGGGAGGITRLDINDPDVSNALGSDVRLELRMLMKVYHLSLHPLICIYIYREDTNMFIISHKISFTVFRQQDR